jgi:DNA-binding FrmR family transcriptional regulator
MIEYEICSSVKPGQLYPTGYCIFKSECHGGIRGIEKMINEDRDCVDLIIQLAAVRSGIEGIGAIVLNNCMVLCLNKDPNANADIGSLSKAISIWGRVRSGE